MTFGHPVGEFDPAPLRALTAELARTAPVHDADATFPLEGITAVHRAGVLTATVGQAYGGPGLGVGQTARLLAALGAGDPSVALITAMTLFQHFGQATRPHWPPELYAEVVRQSAAQPTLLNTARSEPDHGGLPETVARRTASGWAISGHKRFVTGAEGLSYVLVWARTDEPVPRVATFVVPGGLEGIEIVREANPLGLRASGAHDVLFTDVEIPADNVLDPLEESGAQQDNLAQARLGLPLAAIYLGVGRAAQRFFHRFAHERVPPAVGRPLAKTERFRVAAGEIEVLLAGAEELLFGLADRLDQGAAPPTGTVLAARVLAVRQIVSAVQTAVELLGNAGLSREHPLERHFRDVQSARTHAPQEHTVLTGIGAAVLAASQPNAVVPAAQPAGPPPQAEPEPHGHAGLITR
ncbi:acyl-CoA dehydrogenase family protein [Goodfellowiella coeruleoviolacea]|uniref:Acyl-CoA dehydrogenase n=1 Tax=Goodfellowiella coeruleoviolacea TaxID=334858 RepID=A0AAE3GGF5_9PSEU|nr:acyl-CoA dehydrogenase family protein [Goodfellowiella coeruleoviolacea]MCP2167208.1 Acyl-CoA dehydrogenase [Goodfellowiella coeruleoviolacea]